MALRSALPLPVTGNSSPKITRFGTLYGDKHSRAMTANLGRREV